MSMIKDREAKDIFLTPGHWPRVTKLFSLNDGIWLQCLGRAVTEPAMSYVPKCVTCSKIFSKKGGDTSGPKPHCS